MDLEALSPDVNDRWGEYRKVYRKMWLDDLAGYTSDKPATGASGALKQAKQPFPGLEDVVVCANEGVRLIDQLERMLYKKYQVFVQGAHAYLKSSK